jgi:probable rRNA maturation factor
MGAKTELKLAIAPDVGAQYVPFLRRHLRAAHRIVRPVLKELSVAMVGDKKMSDLHQRFMGIAGPTDVLTFPLDADRRGRPVAGEVVVCVPEARRRAKAEGVPVERELLLYALHGMLHLCGYDDRTDASFRAMHRTEDQILTQLGVGPVFAPAASAVPGKPPRRLPADPAHGRAARKRRAASRGAH